MITLEQPQEELPYDEEDIFLTEAHKKNRVEWAARMAERGLEKWETVVLSDEKKFNLDGPDGLA